MGGGRMEKKILESDNNSCVCVCVCVRMVQVLYIHMQPPSLHFTAPFVYPCITTNKYLY